MMPKFVAGVRGTTGRGFIPARRDRDDVTADNWARLQAWFACFAGHERVGVQIQSHRHHVA